MYDRIAKMSRYWFARLIVGTDSLVAGAYLLGIPVERHRFQCRQSRRMWRRRTYQALRARGLTAYETQARMRCAPVALQRRRQIAARQRYRDRWGGDPSKVGSLAWRRWMLARAGHSEVAA